MSDNDNIKVREYINSAVYIEKVYDMSTGDEAAPIYMNIPGSGDHPKFVRVKRCVCFTNPKDCPCHPNAEPDDVKPRRSYSLTRTPRAAPSPRKPQSNDSPVFESDSGITVRATNSTSDDLHLSISSLTNLSTVRFQEFQSREEHFRIWCMRKDQEKKMQERHNLLMKELKKKQKEQQLEVERENFKRWLANKKKEEEAKKLEMERKLEGERIKQEEREKRNVENDLKFQLWLKKKEEVTLEKKIKEEMAILRKEEEKQKRIEYSAKAYEIWFQQSKNKPKPIPLNRGLESLKSSVSVTYINPQPWVPNIEMTQKPTSQ